MVECLADSRSRCARALCLLCTCVVVAQVGYLYAEGVAESPIDPVTTEGDTPCDNVGASQLPGNGDRGSAWFGVDYLLWQLDGNRLPPLVTDGPVTTPRVDVGQLDDPSTVILFGGTGVNDDWRSGYRFSGGYWLDCGHTCAIAADYFNIGGDGTDFVSPQDPGIIVGRPFFNTELGENDLQLVSAPGELDGTAEVRSSDGFQGAGVTMNRCLWRCCDPCCGNVGGEISLLGGYRFYKYDNNLSISEDLTVLPGTMTPLVPGTTFDLRDSFRTRNEFNGGEIGLQGYSVRRWLWLDGMAKVAIGIEQRSVTIDGATTIDVPGGGTFTGAGGLLTAENTNIGSYDDSNFVMIPEFRLGVGAKITTWLAVRAGYNLILWNDVVRAGSSLPPGLGVDGRNLPPPQAGGGADPAFPGIRGSQLVAHGLDAGVTCQW
jgi:hypothetical protein